MSGKLGIVTIEDVKEGTHLFCVNGYVFSENIREIKVLFPYRHSHEGTASFDDHFEWFTGVEVNKKRLLDLPREFHFTDYCIDTPEQKATPAVHKLYPEAKNCFFTQHWFAREYIKKLRNLYPSQYPEVKGVA